LPAYGIANREFGRSVAPTGNEDDDTLSKKENVMKTKLFLVALCLALSIILLGTSLQADEVPRMTKEQLKAMLGNPELVLLDARRGVDWSSSEFKIQGAAYVGGEDYSDWSTRIDRNKTVVLYCA
jgi:hypothetical protein